MPARFSAARILVVGDVMLDRYWFGAVDRISPEAPVPVLLVEDEELRAGGAANVAMNVAALGGQATLCTVTGKDGAARQLKQMMLEAGINATFVEDPDMMTTEKLRLVSRNQQLLRVDRETRPDHELLSAILTHVEHHLDRAQALILSDYGKGGLGHISDILALALDHGVPVCIDPKGDDYERYRKATLITPNENEFAQVAGRWNSDDEFRVKGRQMVKQLELTGLLVTRSEKGMTLFAANGDVTDCPARAMEVYDVSGAGDTVIAAATLTLAAGGSLAEAMAVANEAAGIVVGKLGTATVSAEELSANMGKTQ
ncbi:MAG: D-glycero-beta-D-manno-heptose-7-phosphate kinase [Gammaproteobacteria bacterium]|nr:MAG: D-glycero-beta-D-manno-heptose-7-phosphate kinase [Gammaproteobacteria bacterium]